MTAFQIMRHLFTRNPCYRAGRAIRLNGIMVHSVGCKGTTCKTWLRWDDPKYKKCVHAFVDRHTIMQTLPWDARGWHCGSGASGPSCNNTHISFEICEPLTRNDTAEAARDIYSRVLWLCVYLCNLYGIASRDVISHEEGHRIGRASNHSDVGHWWGVRGTAWANITMDTLRADIARELGERKEKKMERIGTAVVMTQKPAGLSIWPDTRKTKGSALVTVPKGKTVDVYEVNAEIGAGITFHLCGYGGAVGLIDAAYLPVITCDPGEDLEIGEGDAEELKELRSQVLLDCASVLSEIDAVRAACDTMAVSLHARVAALNGCRG